MVNSLENSFWIRKRLIELGRKSGKVGAHFGSSLSAVDILVAVYDYLSQESDFLEDSIYRSRFILSKGHCALALFATLERYGYLSSDKTGGFGQNGSNVFCHAHKNTSEGIEFSGGSLGLGFPFAIGVALSNRLKKIDSKIFLMLGDGECDEGIVWEAAMSASNYNLNNLVVIIDKNGMQSDGLKIDIMDQLDIAQKFAAFGFEVIETDGHSVPEISAAIKAVSNKPIAVVCNTVKGKGVTFMENNPDWHYGSLTELQYSDAVDCLERCYGLK